MYQMYMDEPTVNFKHFFLLWRFLGTVWMNLQKGKDAFRFIWFIKN
jgi:hypothetical protein